jgi:hypothetical protein
VSVILGTQEVEIRKITVRGQPEQKVCKPHLNLSSHLRERLRSGISWFQVHLGKEFVTLHLNGKKLGEVIDACHASYCGKRK